MSVQMTRNNVPVSYLLGSVPFGSLKQQLTVRPPILLPRPETEHWATQVVDALSKLSTEQLQHVRIVDLCTGSGCIALLVADALRQRVGTGKAWKVVACDRSPLAVELARENAVKLGFSINDDGGNVHIAQADVFDNVQMDQLTSWAGGPFDMILSNPPYIPRREWQALPAEVKQHEDPNALIGERHANSVESNDQTSDGRQSYIDRHGLAFHQRLAELLHRSTFSASVPMLPRLVAEYGKGQQRQVERLFAEARAPKDRLPKVIKLEAQLVVVGVGNALTHPLTRHSIGQVVLEPLLRALVEQDKTVRQRLRARRDELEQKRSEAVASGAVGPDWQEALPTRIPILTSGDTQHLDLTTTTDDTAASELVKLGRTSGFSSSLKLLMPASRTSDLLYSVDISLFKPTQPMNLSGVGLKTYLSSHHPQWTPDDILVLQDELDLPFGSVKPKLAGSARGHNGIRDIMRRLGIGETQTLARLRIGIGRPQQPTPQDSWLPATLSKVHKVMSVDRWVLSALSQGELQSCRTEVHQSVLSQVKAQTFEWVLQRCSHLTKATDGARIASSKDQFGVHRSIWVY